MGWGSFHVEDLEGCDGVVRIHIQRVCLAKCVEEQLKFQMMAQWFVGSIQGWS